MWKKGRKCLRLTFYTRRMSRWFRNTNQTLKNWSTFPWCWEMWHYTDQWWTIWTMNPKNQFTEVWHLSTWVAFFMAFLRATFTSFIGFSHSFNQKKKRKVNEKEKSFTRAKKNPKAHFDLSAIHYKNWNESKVFPAVRFAYCFLFTLLGMCRTECFYRFKVCYENEWMEKKVNKSFYIYIVDFELLPFPPSWALFPSNEHEIQASTCLSIHLTLWPPHLVPLIIHNESQLRLFSVQDDGNVFRTRRFYLMKWEKKGEKNVLFRSQVFSLFNLQYVSFGLLCPHLEQETEKLFPFSMSWNAFEYCVSSRQQQPCSLVRSHIAKAQERKEKIMCGKWREIFFPFQLPMLLFTRPFEQLQKLCAQLEKYDMRLSFKVLSSRSRCNRKCQSLQSSRHANKTFHGRTRLHLIDYFVTITEIHHCRWK